MIQTVTGSIDAQEAGIILMHEHIMVGFVEDGKLSPSDYEADDVVGSVLPYLVKLKEAGGSVLFDCSPEYLGRDPYILKQLSELSGVRLVTNTGLYKLPYLPPFVQEASAEELAANWIREAREGIRNSGVLPGFIKIALNDGKVIDSTQLKILHAALRTSLETGLTIQCHTIGGDIALHAKSVMEQEGFNLERFVWIHAQTCDDLSIQQRIVDAGMWISIDSIQPDNYEKSANLLNRLIDLGCGHRILLAQDSGWYNVGQEHGGVIRPYHPLLTDFIPYAVSQGLEEGWLRQCLTRHAFDAMSVRI